MSGIRNDWPSSMISPSRPSPYGGCPIIARCRCADAGRDEAGDGAVRADHPQGRVLGIHQRPDTIHDQLEHRIEVLDHGDRPGRLIERLEGMAAKAARGVAAGSGIA